MKNKSKITIALTAIVTGILVTSLAVAGVGNVSNTNHNFTISPQNTHAAVNQVCVFCHTPHNAAAKGPLWNKANREAATFYRLYTSSKTLSSATRASALTADSPSLLCLGCHDGKTAMNVLHSSAATGADASGAGYPAGTKYIEGSVAKTMNPTGPVWDSVDMVWGPTFNLGRASDGSNELLGYNLSDDHPIGFNYFLAQQEKQLALYTIAQVGINSSNKIKFSGASNKVECTTCHDPHVDTSPAGNPALKPFLVMSNSGSALCLACHNK